MPMLCLNVQESPTYAYALLKCLVIPYVCLMLCLNVWESPKYAYALLKCLGIP